MKVSVVLLLSLVSWVVAFPGDGGLLGGLQAGVGKLLGGGGGLLGIDGGLLKAVGGEAGLAGILGGEKGFAGLKTEGGAELIWGAVSKMLLSKGIDVSLLGKLKDIVLKGVLDKEALGATEGKILELVTGLLKGKASFDLLETIKKLLGGLKGEELGGMIGGGIIEGDLKIKILNLIEEKASKSLKWDGGLEEGNREWHLDKECKEEILKKIEKELLIKKKGGVKLEKTEILKIAEEVIEKEVNEGTLLKKVGTAGSVEIDIHLKEQVTKIIEEKLETELKEAGAWGERTEKLSSIEMEKCSQVIVEKVWQQVLEKKKTIEQLEETEIVKITEEVMKEEIKSGSLLKIISSVEEESSIEISVSVKEKITKLTEEKLTEELKKSGKEELSSEEWSKCNEIILEKLQEELLKKKKDGEILEETEILKIAEVMIEKEVKEGSLLVEIRGGEKHVEVSTSEESKKVIEIKEEKKSSG